jgi:hypothetical protein
MEFLGFRSRKASQGPDRLYIFVTSAIADPYVNVLVHALRTFELSQICFISVAEHDYPNEDVDERNRLRTIVSDVDRVLGELAENKYYGKVRPSETESDPPPKSIGTDHAAIYKACFDKWELLENTSLVIPWRDLDKRLSEFSRDQHGIFDVTALKKNLLVDVVVLLLSRGCDRVFDFEILRKTRYFDERDLIHALAPSDATLTGDFVYRNLTQTNYLRIAQRRMVARSITFRNLLLVTAVVGAAVLLVQIFYPSSWAETAVVAISTTAAIAAWAFLLRRD